MRIIVMGSGGMGGYFAVYAALKPYLSGLPQALPV